MLNANHSPLSERRIFVSFLTFTASQPNLMMCLLTIQCETIFYSGQINKTFICYHKHLESYLLSGFSLPCFLLLHWESCLCYPCNHLAATLYYPCNYFCEVLNISYKKPTSPFVCHGTLLNL